MGLPSLGRSFPGSGSSLSVLFVELGLADSVGSVSVLNDGVSRGPLGLFDPLVSLLSGTLVLVFGVLSLVVVDGLNVALSPLQVGLTLGLGSDVSDSVANAVMIGMSGSVVAGVMTTPRDVGGFGGLAGFTNAGLEVNSDDSGEEGSS
jgi:hypothetical protein